MRRSPVVLSTTASTKTCRSVGLKPSVSNGAHIGHPAAATPISKADFVHIADRRDWWMAERPLSSERRR